jgi:hypothetical protein
MDYSSGSILRCLVIVRGPRTCHHDSDGCRWRSDVSYQALTIISHHFAYLWSSNSASTVLGRLMSSPICASRTDRTCQTETDAEWSFMPAGRPITMPLFLPCPHSESLVLIFLIFLVNNTGREFFESLFTIAIISYGSP